MPPFAQAACENGVLAWRRSAFGDWDIRSASFGEQAIDHLRTKFRVAPRAGDAEDLEFGTDQGEADREDIVDVVADVGVDDDLYRLSGRGLRLRARARRRRDFWHVETPPPLKAQAQHKLRREFETDCALAAASIARTTKFRNRRKRMARNVVG